MCVCVCVIDRGRVCLLKQKDWERRWSAVFWMETIIIDLQTDAVSVPRNDHGLLARGCFKRPRPVATAAKDLP